MSKLNRLILIKKARDLLSDEIRWTKGSLARDINNKEISYDSRDAVKFCLMGALYSQTNNGKTLSSAEYALDKHIKDDNLVNFNDSINTTHKDVLNLLDITIKDLTKKYKEKGYRTE